MDDIAQSNPLAAIDDRFVYRGARRQHVAFPLGGIGSGSVSLTGSGRLVDWSIRNRPAIHQHNGYSHFAIKAERDGELVDARVLNGPYEGVPTGSPSRRKFDGYGFGANRNSMAGVPHFDDAVFVGRFPVAEIEFMRDAFPGKVRMTAFSPFIPHNDRDTSMPAALFSFEIENDTDAPIDYTIAATLGNYGCDSGVHGFSRSGPLSALHFTSADVDRPAMAARRSRDHDRGRRSRARRLSRARAMVRQPEPLLARIRAARSVARAALRGAARRPPTCSSSPSTARSRVAFASRRARRARVRFAITWNYPTGAIYWFNRSEPGEPEYSGEPPTWRNYYATQWADSLASGAEAFRRWEELEGATCAFRDSLFGSSTPAEIIDAVSGTLGVLRSATVIRLEGGELWGWEGQHIGEGSCEGSCTHVWNYQQALAWLFPSAGDERCARPSSPTISCRTAD